MNTLTIEIRDRAVHDIAARVAAGLAAFHGMDWPDYDLRIAHAAAGIALQIEAELKKDGRALSMSPSVFDASVSILCAMIRAMGDKAPPLDDLVKLASDAAHSLAQEFA